MLTMRVAFENHGSPEPTITLSGSREGMRGLLDALLDVGTHALGRDDEGQLVSMAVLASPTPEQRDVTGRPILRAVYDSEAYEVRAEVSTEAAEIYEMLFESWMQDHLIDPGDHVHLEFYPEDDDESGRYMTWIFVIDEESGEARSAG